MNQLPPEHLREIPKWTRAYALNRTLPALVFMAGWLALFVSGSRFFTRAGAAYRAGDKQQFAVWLAAGLICIAAIMLTAVRSVMRKLRSLLFRAFYSREGELEVGAPPDRRPWSYLVAAMFILGVLALVFLGSQIPERYHQPVSALFILPFLILVAPSAGLAGILYPLLYGLHAILLLVSAPIEFHGEWAPMNIVVPVAGYGLFSLVVGHIYNRIALRRLRSLARQA